MSTTNTDTNTNIVNNDVNTVNHNGETELMMSVKLGNEACVKMRTLINLGADVNIQNCKGYTALMYTAIFGDEHSVEMMRLLIDAGADVNIQNYKGYTALIITVQKGHLRSTREMMQLLIDSGADFNIQSKNGYTALMYAVLYGGKHATGMIRLLLDAGADANKHNESGWTVLMVAASEEDRGTFEAILAQWRVAEGDTIDARLNQLVDEDGPLPILRVRDGRGQKDSIDIIHTLIRMGADIFKKDYDENTIFDMTDSIMRGMNKNIYYSLHAYKNNWIFEANKFNSYLWSDENIQSIRYIHTVWKGDKKSQSSFSKLPWDILRDIILPMVVDRKDTVMLKRKYKN